MIVGYTETAERYLIDLVIVLLKRPYYLSEDKAHEYVDTLYNYVVYYIPLLRPAKKLPNALKSMVAICITLLTALISKQLGTYFIFKKTIGLL